MFTVVNGFMKSNINRVQQVGMRRQLETHSRMDWSLMSALADWTCSCFTSKPISIIMFLRPGHLLKISKFTVCYTLLIMGKHFAINNTVSLRDQLWSFIRTQMQINNHLIKLTKIGGYRFHDQRATSNCSNRVFIGWPTLLL